MQKTYEDLMIYVIKSIKDGQQHKNKEIQDNTALLANLTEEEMQEYLPSGKQLTYRNRINWAIIYLSRAGIINRIARGVYALSESGKELINNLPERIDNDFLMQYEPFSQWLSSENGQNLTESNERNSTIDEATPEDKINEAIKIINKNLAVELLTEILSNTPAFFESLVVRLLVAMGYGGIEDARVVGGSGDDGIDGIINSDKLGFEKICIQAKRYDIGNNVSNQEIRNFSGALLQKGVTKGVFITTSSFTDKAIRAAKSITQQKIILIDGTKLTNLMIDYNIGVSEVNTFSIKKLDIDFFEE